MKKKFTAVTLLLTLVLICAAVFASCDSQNGLAFGKKYVNKNTINKDDQNQADYYVFNSDGTGTYYYKYATEDFSYDADYSGIWTKTVYDYKFNFKYVFTDDEKSAIVCFYDGQLTDNSMKYNAKKDEQGNFVRDENGDRVYSEEGTAFEYASDTSWSVIITVSKNVLAGAGTYVNEDYAKQLTEYNKSAETDE